jgi:hypothetical protein
VNPNATWNVSLESYHPYLLPQEVLKGPTTLGTYGSLPKNGKGHFDFLSPSGVKATHVQSLELAIRKEDLHREVCKLCIHSNYMIGRCCIRSKPFDFFNNT